MNINENQWKSMNINEQINEQSMNINETSMKNNEKQWKSESKQAINQETVKVPAEREQASKQAIKIQ